MSCAAPCLAVVLAALGGDPTDSAGPVDLTDRFEAPEGLTVGLWAESPALYNPTAIDVDARGRVWVAEAVNYRQWRGRNPGLRHEGGDRIVILADTDGDGAADSSKVFVQDPDLTSPLGIAVVGDRVFVSCSPNLFVYIDADGDDVPDERRTLLTGFGGFDHDHGLHSVVHGPDGRLWFNTGNAGPHLVEDALGWWLRSGSFYSGGGPEVADNRPGLVSDDGHAWTGGLVLAALADGSELTVLAHNFRNNYEVAVDAFGDFYQSDNDDDGNRSCRVLWCLEGGNHGFFSADGTRSWQADRRPGQATEVAHWHQDDPGVVPAGSITGAGGPTGICVVEGSALGPEMDGALLSADAGANVVFAHRVTRRGAGVDVRTEDFLRSRPAAGETEARWFRPSDVAVGADGAIYVADWYDPGVGGHMMGDREAYGRILRMAPGDAPGGGAPALDLETREGRLRALASPAVNVRALGFEALRSGEEARETLRAAWRGSDDARLRARCLWLLAGPDHRDHAAVREALGEADERLRLVAVRALARRTGDRLTTDTVRRLDLVRDPSAAVRRETLVKMRGVVLERALPLLVELARRFDGEDRTYLEAFGLVWDDLAPAERSKLWSELAAELGDVPSRWDARFAGLAWRCHPPEALAAHGARAVDPTLASEERRRAVDAIAFTPGREAGEAMVLIALSGPEDVRELARWWVRSRDGNDWRGYGLLALLGGGSPDGAREAWASDVVRSGAVPVDVPLEDAESLWLVAEDAGDGNACDWVDWIAPRFVDADGGEHPLTGMEWLHAEAEWGAVRRDANCVGEAMRVGDREGLSGIGAHAASTVGVAVPESAVRFVAEAGVDRGGTDQNGGRTTSVRFRVLVAEDRSQARLDAVEARALDADLALDERLAAAAELARDPKGALRWIARAEAGSLAPELEPAVAAAIYENPDFAVRALASRHFRSPGVAADLPPIAELARIEGDPVRGKALFLDEQRTQCIACHTIRRGDSLRGRDVGPDLTRIREKYGAEALFDAILHPSAGIAFGYESWLVETTDGELYSGFVLADGRDLVLKDTQGERWVIPADEVASKQAQTISTMPEGVALGLSAGELADLVAFLLEDPDVPPTVGGEVRLFDGESLAGWSAFPPESAGAWSVAGGVLRCEGQPIGYLQTDAEHASFHLSLEWRFDPERGAGNSGVLLRKVGADGVWPKSIEAQLHSRDAGDIWNIGAFDMDVDPRRTSGRRTMRMAPSNERPLGEWNRYDIVLRGPRLELYVNGALQNTADWCDEVPGRICLQSEGAYIEFRDLVLRPIAR